MEPSFKIVFDFNLDESSRVLQLKGKVELRHSEPHYRVTGIKSVNNTTGAEILPDVDIKCILADGEYKWVYTDSGKETYLSRAIGKSIEKMQPSIEIAWENTDPDDEFL